MYIYIYICRYIRPRAAEPVHGTSVEKKLFALALGCGATGMRRCVAVGLVLHYATCILCRLTAPRAFPLEPGPGNGVGSRGWGQARTGSRGNPWGAVREVV